MLETDQEALEFPPKLAILPGKAGFINSIIKAFIWML